MFLKENKSPKDDLSDETTEPPTHATRKAVEERTPAPQAVGVPSIISPDLKIIGNVTSSGDIQIDGSIEGDVESRSVVVGEGAKVEGAVIAETARISGAVNGQIQAKSVTLDRTAEVLGDIVHGSLIMEAGAFLEGSVRRMDPAGDTPDKVASLRRAQAGNGHERKFSDVQSAPASG